jgi:hypothetical protein
MPSHAPLCGINRPHARYWSRTNRIDSILESPPVTSDTATVPPPTRSPEPKVTRYIVIRNDQHSGSPHHGRIFIVAGNRLTATHPPEKRQLPSVTISRARLPCSGFRAGFRARQPVPPGRFSGLGRAERRASRGAGVRLAGIRPASARRADRPATLLRASAISARPGAPTAPRPRPRTLFPARGSATSQPDGADPGHFRSYEDVQARPGRNDHEDFFPDVRNESHKCTNSSRSWARPGYSPAFTTQLRWPRTR